MNLRKLADSVATSIPVVSDAKEHYWSFFRNRTAVRGVFKTFDDALHAMPAHATVGYDQSDLGPDQTLSQTTAAKTIGQLDSRDYPILFWLKAALPGTTSVFNLGGNVGTEYYSYLRYLPEIARLSWIICEIPHVAAAGRRLASARNASNLTFTESVEDGDGCSILICTGTLQYLPYALDEAMAAWRVKPSTVIIADTPAWDGPSFVTIQNVGYAFVPYRVFSKPALEMSFKALGYRLADEWKYPRRLSVPFARDHTLDSYCGFAFVRDA